MPILELSGAKRAVDSHGFTKKWGAIFRWGGVDTVVDWKEMYGEDHHAWQVDRSSFDAILLNNAEEQGVNVLEGARVERIDLSEAHPWVRWTDPEGVANEAQYSYLVDASGRAGLISAQYHHDRKSNEAFENVAIWSYWDRARPLPGTPAGGINSISTEDGWFWVIPLANGQWSVGYVTHRDVFREQRRRHATDDELLEHLIDAVPAVRELLAGGSRCARTRIEQDYSYMAGRFCGPGYYLIGDAACFLDPLLSTGVHLALFSAMLASACIVSTLDGTVTDEEARKFYEYGLRGTYVRLFTLVANMYERRADPQYYLRTARRLNRGSASSAEDEPSVRDFVDLSAGLADLRDLTGDDRWTRAVVDRFAAQAREEQVNSPHQPGTTPGGLNFYPVHSVPFDLAAPTDTGEVLQLVVDPALGLRRRPDGRH
ncbi:tryptophan 7-halogenase [Actinomadura terrae]|uniref:tryptophan 7-halogenase n=1 Tax=Actinomadura terrae TaxID=604353 RepID=UPI001FA7B695|nr:tryptophan 7-halogenase [Actinomadura terrae]